MNKTKMPDTNGREFGEILHFAAEVSFLRYTSTAPLRKYQSSLRCDFSYRFGTVNRTAPSSERAKISMFHCLLRPHSRMRDYPARQNEATARPRRPRDKNRGKSHRSA